MYSIQIKLALSILAAACFVACSTEPQVTELANSADPQTEITRVDHNTNAAISNQVDILSPRNFNSAQTYLSKAIKSRSQNGDQKVTLHNLAVAQAYLDKANSTAGVSQQILNEALTARHDALTAFAVKNYPSEMSSADNQLKIITEQIENNDTSNAELKKSSFVSTYRDLEMKSIKKEKLGNAQLLIEQSIQEGAKKLTPETLSWAQKEFSASNEIMTANRHNTSEINKAGLRADNAANRLLKMVRNAKNSTAKNPEDLAKLAEKNELAAASSEQELNIAENNLTRSETKLEHATNLNQKLESQARLDKEFDAARAAFTENEAEVYKQGDKILIRLKGLSFASNKSTLGTQNFPLLAKVQKVIGDIGSSQIVIEGHTDSIGGKELNDKLSTQRAESVQSYLIANKNITQDKIKASGFGYTKPIATNKTAKGRAQNRRIDVIISADPITE